MFIVVQPTLQVLPLIPKKLWPWFTHLAWVQVLCCCRCRASQRRRRVPRVARAEETAVSTLDQMPVSEIPVSLEARGRMGSTASEETVWSTGGHKEWKATLA